MIYLLLFLSFLKIGTFTFGGGHAMIPLIQQEILKYNWMSLEELINFIAISESTPGPFAINIATFVGYRIGGIIGSILTNIGVIFSSFFIILFIARYFEKYKKNRIMQYCMVGLKPVIIGLIGATIISTGITIFFPEGNFFNTLTSIKFWKSIFIFIITLILAIKKVNPIKIIILSAILGIILGFI